MLLRVSKLNAEADFLGKDFRNEVHRANFNKTLITEKSRQITFDPSKVSSLKS